MKMKLYRIISAAILALMTAIYGCVYAGAASVNMPITANESNATIWIFAGVVCILAVAGIIYFIISNKKK